MDKNVRDIIRKVLGGGKRDIIGDGLGKFVGKTVGSAVGSLWLRMCPRICL